MTIKPREIWEKGIPLNEAWDVWATEENYKKLEEEHENYFSNPSENISFADGLRRLSSGVLKFNKLQQDKTAALSRMRRDLIEWLTEEELFALGFPVLPAAERTPRLISKEFWINAKIDWEGEIANDEVSKFQRITVVGPEDFPEINIKPKVGRKSHKDLIIRAIQELEKITSDFENYTNKNKTNRIWDYLNIHNPELIRDSRGLKDDTLRKIISSYYKNKN